MAMIHKNDDSDLDMDDVITEAPTSPQNHSPSITPPPHNGQPQQQQQQQAADKEVVVPNGSRHEIGKDKEQIQSLKIKRTSDSTSYRIVANDQEKNGTQTRPKTPKNVKEDRPASPNEQNQSKQAARISKRRTTLARQCNESNASNGIAGKKRRLSCSTKNSDYTEEAGTAHRTRNASVSADNDTTTTSKRMRLERNADAAQTLSTTPKRIDTTKTNQANSNSLSSNIVAASAVDTTVSTPRTKKSANLRDKPKATTPRITQYFAQQKTSTPVQAPSTATTPAPAAVAAAAAVAAPAPASLMCDTCSIILSSANELNFHKKSHELNCCVKCKKPIDNAENPISAHTVSCFLLDNKISNDLLTRFLKVKVDLNRLTPGKIKQIQMDLQSDESKNATNGATAQLSVENTTNRDHESNAKEPPDSVGRRQSKEKPRRESSPSAVEGAQNSTNDGKNDSGMSFFLIFFSFFARF